MLGGTRELTSLSREEPVVRWASCQQEELASTVGLGDKTAAGWAPSTWETDPKDLVPCLRQ